MGFTTEQKAAIAAIADAFLPSLERENDPDGYWKRAGSDLPLPDLIEDTVLALPGEEQKEFTDLLDLMNSWKLGLTWFGPMKSVKNLTVEQREKMLKTWSASSLPILRKGYSGLKKLVMIHYFGYSTQETENPNWKTLGYPGPLEQKGNIQDPVSYSTERLDGNAIISCDVVVIGSGAGGGVVAAELVKKGYEVVVLEKGPFLKEEDMTMREGEMLAKSYDRKGAFISDDGGTTILAGACVGGGTTVNWSASFRTPDYILEEWADEHDNPHFKSPDYKKCFEAIEARTGMKKGISRHNPQNSVLLKGAKVLGYHHDDIPRNVAPNQGMDEELYWKSQGYGTLCDALGTKQGTLKTFLKDAVEGGAKIYADTRVDTVTHASGTVSGVIAYQSDENGHRFKLTVSCKKVVVCAGALHTPAILMASGLSHPQIGRNLYLHPTNAVSAEYAEPVDGWFGPMMSAVSDEFTRLDGNFGYKIETPPLHAGFSALSTPWNGGEEFKESLLGLRNFGSFIVLTRDKFGGSIKINARKRPIATYRLNKYDRNHLVHGMVECAKIHKAAGAKSIRLLRNEPTICDLEKDDFDNFLKKIQSLSWAPNRFILYSAHQMGTCRMGGRDADHPIKPNGETREIKNLFIADASAFPRCSGVNPMLSIQALAYHIAQGI